MDIKQLRPSRKSKYKQGYVRPDSCKKYFGSGPIIYRSSYERKFIVWLESNKRVARWTSEAISIPYKYIDGKIHRYYPDYYVEMVDGRKFIIEIKPYNQTHPPVNDNLYANREWSKNVRKWDSARQFCKEHGLEFQIIIENTINKL